MSCELWAKISKKRDASTIIFHFIGFVDTSLPIFNFSQALLNRDKLIVFLNEFN